MVKREAGSGLTSKPVQKKIGLRKESIYMFLWFFYSFYSFLSLSNRSTSSFSLKARKKNLWKKYEEHRLLRRDYTVPARWPVMSPPCRNNQTTLIKIFFAYSEFLFRFKLKSQLRFSQETTKSPRSSFKVSKKFWHKKKEKNNNECYYLFSVLARSGFFFFDENEIASVWW